MRYSYAALALYGASAIVLIVDFCLLKAESVTQHTAVRLFLVGIVLFITGNHFRKIAKYWKDKT